MNLLPLLPLQKEHPSQHYCPSKVLWEIRLLPIPLQQLPIFQEASYPCMSMDTYYPGGFCFPKLDRYLWNTFCNFISICCIFLSFYWWPVLKYTRIFKIIFILIKVCRNYFSLLQLTIYWDYSCTIYRLIHAQYSQSFCTVCIVYFELLSNTPPPPPPPLYQDAMMSRRECAIVVLHFFGNKLT